MHTSIDEAFACAGSAAVPGLSIAIVEGGELVAEQAFGNARAGEPMRTDHLLQAASLAKPLTACAMLRLIEQRKAALDAPVNALLRSWQVESAGHPVEKITLRRVLCHCAGLSTPDYPGLPPSLPVPTIRASLQGVAGLPLTLIAAPGSGFAYSGGGYALLQLLIEELTGEGFAAHMARTLFAPLAMYRSSFDPESPLAAFAATGHDADGAALPFYRFDAAAAAGLLCTAADLARFLGALIDGRVLGEAARRVMLAPAVDTGGADGLWPKYALGFEVDALPGGRTAIGHHGMNRGFRALMAADIDAGRAVVALANGDGAMPALERIYSLWCAQ